MSYCKVFGKDKIIFATKEDHAVPSTVTLPESEPAPGLILPSGEINWNCPCLGGMATGPCGVEFRNAFSCFHYSDQDPKGSECYDSFKSMQECFAKYPSVYNKTGDDESSHDIDDVVTKSSEIKGTVTIADTAEGLEDSTSSNTKNDSKNNTIKAIKK